MLSAAFIPGATDPRPQTLIKQSPRYHRAISVFALLLPCAPAFSQPTQPTQQPPAPLQAILHRTTAVTTLTLPSGIDVHIRPMASAANREGPRVYITMLVPGLELFETPANRGISSLAAQSLEPPPNSPFRARASLVPEGLSVRITCTKAQAPAALAVLASILSNPTLDATRFETIRAATIKNRARPQGQNQVAAEAMMNLMFPTDDIRLRRPTVDELTALTLENSQAYLTAHLAQRPADVAIVGDITLPDVLPAIQSSLATLPPRPRDRLHQLRDVPRKPATPGPAPVLPGPMTQGQALISISLPAPASTDINETRLAAVAARLLQDQATGALKDAGISVRLSSGVAMTGRLYPRLGATVATFMVAADEKTAARAAAIVTSTISTLAREGPTLAARNRAVDDALAEIEPRLKSPDYWSQSLSVAWFEGVDIDDLAGAPNFIRSVTPATLRDHLARWWKPADLIQVTLIPDPAAPTPAPPAPAPQNAPQNPQPNP